MGSKLTQTWIPLDRIEAMVQLEPAIFVLLLAFTSYLVYKLFLGGISPERHRNMRRHFRNLFAHAVILIASFSFFWSVQNMFEPGPAVLRGLSYVGLLTVIWGCIVFIKTTRILAFEYLFFFNMQAGVPLLLINILSLVVSLFVGAWVISGVFGFQLGPVLATSAAFSVVLGLALQETLGNLFAGVAIQIDKPFAIGDWVEIFVNGQKIVGQVDEISWRATVLIGLTEELTTIPNRIVAQSQVSNFATKRGPIIRSQLFRLPLDCDLDEVRTVLLKSCEGIRAIRRHPEPTVLFTETTESWVSVKLIFYLDDYAAQFSVNTELISKVLKALKAAKIELATSRMDVRKSA